MYGNRVQDHGQLQDKYIPKKPTPASMKIQRISNAGALCL